ncbi:MAG: helix-turn-helix transcriptional regulator [Flavobacteriales bacterium]|nr:helix-turn-helix transcriptional regulator [Flavobacteriales bacterium]
MSKKMTTPENDALFGYRIWQLRKKYGWERSLLAHHLGVPEDHLMRLEYGELPLYFETAIRMAQLMRCKVSDFEPVKLTDMD